MVHTRDLRHEPWRYRLRAFVSKPANLLLVFFLTVLVLLSLLPMATMLSNMFTVHVGTEKKLLRLPVDSTTLWHFQKLFAGDDWSQVNFWQPLCNSLIVARLALRIVALSSSVASMFLRIPPMSRYANGE